MKLVNMLSHKALHPDQCSMITHLFTRIIPQPTPPEQPRHLVWTLGNCVHVKQNYAPPDMTSQYKHRTHLYPIESSPTTVTWVHHSLTGVQETYQ